jgi:hypothetical protein
VKDEGCILRERVKFHFEPHKAAEENDDAYSMPGEEDHILSQPQV